jgi:hypothetical protein
VRYTTFTAMLHDKFLRPTRSGPGGAPPEAGTEREMRISNAGERAADLGAEVDRSIAENRPRKPNLDSTSRTNGTLTTTCARDAAGRGVPASLEQTNHAAIVAMESVAIVPASSVPLFTCLRVIIDPPRKGAGLLSEFLRLADLVDTEIVPLPQAFGSALRSRFETRADSQAGSVFGVVGNQALVSRRHQWR